MWVYYKYTTRNHRQNEANANFEVIYQTVGRVFHPGSGLGLRWRVGSPVGWVQCPPDIPTNPITRQWVHLKREVHQHVKHHRRIEPAPYRHSSGQTKTQDKTGRKNKKKSGKYWLNTKKKQRHTQALKQNQYHQQSQINTHTQATQLRRPVKETHPLKQNQHN